MLLKKVMDEVVALYDEISVLGHYAGEFLRWKRNLTEREHELNRREEELNEAVNAMVEVYEAVESGAAKVVNEKLMLSRWPDIIDRMRGPGRDDVSSPVRRLISGFVRLVARLSKRTTDRDALFVDYKAPRL